MTAGEKMWEMLESGDLDWEAFGREAYQQMSSDECDSVAEALDIEADDEESGNWGEPEEIEEDEEDEDWEE